MTGDAQRLEQYGQLSISARKELATRDPGAARIMALGKLLILATSGGIEAVHQRVAHDRAVALSKRVGIGISNDGDADWKENSELHTLKIEAPIYAEIYAESAGELKLTHLYAEELPGRLGFGSLFEATILYPRKADPSVRRYALVGPNEVGQQYPDHSPASGGDFRAISYLSPLGSAVWGVDLTDLHEHPITFALPDQGNATIMAINVLDHVA